MNRPLKCQGAAVCLQEVPDEIAVAFNITDCPHRCDGCHSQDLWSYTGEPFALMFQQILDSLTYTGGVTCVCFMGGEWRPRELIYCARLAHKLGFKVCLYTGADSLKVIDGQLLQHLDYIKFGSWQRDHGPLSDPNTNQRMFKLRDDQNRPAVFDITHKFQKEYL